MSYWTKRELAEQLVALSEEDRQHVYRKVEETLRATEEAEEEPRVPVEGDL